MKVQLNTDFKDIKKDIEYERLFYTGAIDEFFDYKFGKLPYR
ncbi:UDP-galactopyranose mutase, partial [Campylobacter jejuni]